MRKLTLAVLALSALTLTSCNDKEDGDDIVLYDFTLAASNYNIEGYWNDVYNTGYTTIAMFPDLQLTHSASVDVYEGVEYKSWMGFCPSESTDKKNHNGEDWVKYQWGNITGHGATGAADRNYMIAHWDVNETLSAVPSPGCCAMGSIYGVAFRPLQMYMTNTTWGYWAMKEGSAFSRAFGPDDWCKVTITGVNGYTKTGSVDFYLARDGKIVDEWELVDLTPLGKCSAIYFQMQSSDTGQWGMNNPAYFAMDELVCLYTKN